MKLITVTQSGMLTLTEAPDPPPAGGTRLIIRVEAAGVNRADILQKRGLYPPPTDHSSVLGLEVAGVIVAIGPQVTEWKVGDRVCALVNGGGYAEFCETDEVLCLPVPPDFLMHEAAVLPESFFTVAFNILIKGQLKTGDSLLVHGGTGALGTAAAKISKIFNFLMIATTSSAKKKDFCLSCGAHHVIDRSQENWPQKIQEITHNKGVSMVLDYLGGEFVEQNIFSLATEGQYALVGLLHNKYCHTNLVRILTRKLTLFGSTLRSLSLKEKMHIRDTLNNTIWNHPDIIRPTLDSTYALEEAEKAHQRLEDPSCMGRIALIGFHD